MADGHNLTERSAPRADALAHASHERPEAVVFGRLHADFYPLQARTHLADVESFHRFLGGFAGNVSVGLARLGVAAAVVSGVGADGHGDFILKALTSEGVAIGAVRRFPELRTAISFCELWPPNNFPLTAYRLPTCPDWQIQQEDMPVDQVARAPIVYVSGTGLAQDPSRATTLAALEGRRAEQRGEQVATILDLDLRTSYWRDPREYAPQVARAVPFVDTVIGGDEELAAAQLTAAELLRAGVRRVFVKHGPDGATLIDEDGAHAVPAAPTVVVNGLGAGDAFAAAVGWGLLRGQPGPEVLQRANVAGAIVAGRLACAAAMPSADELSERAGPRRPDPSLRRRRDSE